MSCRVKQLMTLLASNVIKHIKVVESFPEQRMVKAQITNYYADGSTAQMTGYLDRDFISAGKAFCVYPNSFRSECARISKIVLIRFCDKKEDMLLWHHPKAEF